MQCKHSSIICSVGCYDGKVYVLARCNGKIVWTYQTEDVVKSSPCVDLQTGLIWVGSHDGCLYSLDIDSKVCKMRVHCKKGSCFSSPAISYDPHCVYVGTLAGYFLCIDAFSGDVKWFKRFRKPIFATPFVHRQHVFVATVNGRLKCLSHFGEEIWEFRTDDHVFSSPVGVTSQNTIGGDVVLSSHGCKIYRVTSDGKLRWSTLLNGPVYATPCFIFWNYDLPKHVSFSPEPLDPANSACVLVVTTKGTMYLLDACDGRIVKTFFLLGEVFSSPIVFGNHIVVGCRDDYLCCIDSV